ncbi:MAG TPA: type II CAAX endopeptidase family protein [Pyrinomonadaceae bacterium]|nr:type II CAAX endopeptidase family protein [Pyrinomonadaceae bacterium]
MDTPTETPHNLASGTGTNALAGETTTSTPPYLSGAQTSTASPAAPETHADDPAWGLMAAFGLWFASVGLLVVSGVLALAVYVVLRRPSLDAASLGALQSDPLLILLSIAAMVPVHLLTFGMAWAVVTGFGKRPFRTAVGWSWSGRFGFWTCVGLAIGLWLFGITLATLFGGQETDIDRIIASSHAARLSIAFLAVATAPIVEETIYRGVLFAPLQRAAGTKAAIGIVSVMFAAVHLVQYRNNLGVIAAVVGLSFTLTWVRAHTGRLLPCFAIHAAFNGIQAIIIVAQPYLKTLLPTPPAAPQGMLLDALVRAFVAVQL